MHYRNNVPLLASMIILLLDHATSPGHHSLVPPARNAVASEFRNWGVDRRAVNSIIRASFAHWQTLAKPGKTGLDAK